MIVRVKICGITNSEDALAAVAAGADALGFMFYPKSPRAVSRSQALQIVSKIPPFVSRVGVFVNPTEEEVLQAMDEAQIDTCQLHGDESPEFCARLNKLLPVVKAIRVKDTSSILTLGDWNVRAVLLDTFAPGQLGGTGTVFNWDLAIEAKQFGRPVVLAGGLTADNVAHAVAKVRPFGVDVSSGVESSPGKKDGVKMEEFISRAKAS